MAYPTGSEVGATKIGIHAPAHFVISRQFAGVPCDPEFASKFGNEKLQPACRTDAGVMLSRSAYGPFEIGQGA